MIIDCVGAFKLFQRFNEVSWQFLQDVFELAETFEALLEPLKALILPMARHGVRITIHGFLLHLQIMAELGAKLALLECFVDRIFGSSPRKPSHVLAIRTQKQVNQISSH